MNRIAGEHARIRPLDGLRGIAILLVLWFHFWEISWFSHEVKILGQTFNFDFIPISGFIGVDLFFFVSGFCLFWPLSHEGAEGLHRGNILNYIYRRAIKILPSYWLAIFVILIFFEKSFQTWQQTAWHAFTHLFFIHNFWGDTYGSINGVLWSLAIEVQFYVLFPAVAWLFKRNPLAVWAAAATGAAAYRYYFAYSGRDDYEFFMNQLPGVIDLFLSGMLAAQLLRWLSRREDAWIKPTSTVLAPVFAAVFLGLLYKFYQVRYDVTKGHFLTTYRTLFALDFIALAVLSCRAASAWIALLANPAFTYLSLISYNLYIWHQFLGRLMVQSRMPASAHADPHNDADWRFQFMLFAILVSIALASAITYLFERPLLKRQAPGPFKPRH
ncbi:MAG TPA: acyltransferase [Bdellovibrionales bacterium]|nr:acyltransferase [Bdellovibrionales bacterium]